MLAPNPNPEPASATKWHDVTVVRKRKLQLARVEGVPPEEFGISKNARSIRDAGYCFHRVHRSQADLIADGYDEDQVKALPSYTLTTNIEEFSRDTVQESLSRQADDALNTANRQIWVTEHYIRMDYEGDGKARLYRVTTGGAGQGDDSILKRDGDDEIIEIDHIPFAAMTPVPMTHRFFGRSVADLVLDIQRIKTALLRAMLDNAYLANNPRIEVPESHASDSTLDDLLISRPGGIVRTKLPDGLNVLQHPDIGAQVFPLLQYQDATREWRTGVSRQGQGVDPNALQNQVATIANQMFNASQAKMKLIARIFAETGIKDLFLLLHATIRKHGSQPQTVQLRNKWVEVDPRDWKKRDDMTVNVGLGTGSKAEQLANLQLIIAAQEKVIPLGMVSPRNAFESAKELTKLAGHKDTDRFFSEPGAPGNPGEPAATPIQPAPDPKHAEIAAKAQAEQQKMQADQAHQQMRMNMEMQLEQQKFELDKQLKLIDAELKARQHAHQVELENLKAAHDAQLKTAEAHAKAQAATAPKASIEVKHGADEVVGPIAEVLGKVGEHLSANQAAHTQAIMTALGHMTRNKRARKLPDGSWVTEHLQ